MATTTKTRSTTITAGSARTTTRPTGTKPATTASTAAAKTVSAGTTKTATTGAKAASASTSAKASPATIKSGKGAPQPTAPAQPTGFLGRLLGPMNAPQGTTTNAQGKPANPLGGRFLLGMVIYLIGSQILISVLTVLDAKNRWGLNTKMLFKIPLFNAPVTPFILIYLVLIASLLYVLNKFHFFPSAAQRREQIAAARSTSASKGTGTKTLSANGKPIKSVTTTRPTTGKVAAASAGANAKAAPKKTVAEPVVEDDEPGENDDLYQQVQSQIRSQARKRKR